MTGTSATFAATSPAAALGPSQPCLASSEPCERIFHLFLLAVLVLRPFACGVASLRTSRFAMTPGEHSTGVEYVLTATPIMLASQGCDPASFGVDGVYDGAVIVDAGTCSDEQKAANAAAAGAAALLIVDTTAAIPGADRISDVPYGRIATNTAIAVRSLARIDVAEQELYGCGEEGCPLGESCYMLTGECSESGPGSASDGEGGSDSSNGSGGGDSGGSSGSDPSGSAHSGSASGSESSGSASHGSASGASSSSGSRDASGSSASGSGENVCDSFDPCLNGGECLVVGDELTCTCTEGWTGPFCGENLEQDVCDPNPCEHDGTCSLGDDGDAHCECGTGYSGDRCEVEDEPTSDACDGGVTVAVDGVTQFGWWNANEQISGYPNSLACSWHVDIPVGKVAFLWFDRIDTMCSNDVVSVVVDEQVIGSYCGEQAADIDVFEIHGTGLDVEFTTVDGGDHGYFGFWVGVELEDAPASGAGSSASGTESSSSEPPRDCEVGEWSYWSDCEASADGTGRESCDEPGTRRRIRDILEPPSEDGEPCPELDQVALCLPSSCLPDACHVDTAPEVHDSGSGRIGLGNPPNDDGLPRIEIPEALSCVWRIGAENAHVDLAIVWADVDASGTEEICDFGVIEVIGLPSEHIARVCRGSAGDAFSFDGVVTVQLTTSAESIGHLGSGFSMDFEVVEQEPNVDCAVSDWTEWSDCDPDCGVGQRSRRRVVLQEAEGSGAPCPPEDEMRQEEECNNGPCAPTDVTAAATVVVGMREDVFNAEFLSSHPDFEETFANDVAEALGIPRERISIVEVTLDPPSVMFEILPAHGIPGSPASHLVNVLRSSLNDEESQLWSGGASSFISREVPMSAAFADPAEVEFLPASVEYTDPSSGSTAVVVRNNGGSVLVVTGISVAGDAGGFFSVSEPHSFNIQPRSTHALRFDFSPAGLAAGRHFKVVEIEHNVPNGPHAIPVTVVVDAASSSSSSGSASHHGSHDKPDGIIGYIDEQGFLPGVVAAAAAMVLLGLCGCFSVWCYRRKVRPFCRTLCGHGVRDLEAQRRARMSTANARSDSRAESTGSAEEETSSMLRSTDTGVEMSSVGVTVSSGTERRGPAGGSTYAASASPWATAAAPSDSRPSGAPRSAAAARTARPGTAGGAGGSSAGSRLALVPKPKLRAEDFEPRWNSLATVEVWGATLRAPLANKQMEETLGKANIRCMASGVIDGVQKYYFYAEDSDGALFMAEVSVTGSSMRVSAVIKAANAAKGAQFVAIFKQHVARLVRE